MFLLPIGVDIQTVSLCLVPCRECGRHGRVNLQVVDLVVRQFAVGSAQGARELYRAFLDAGGRSQPDFLKQVQAMEVRDQRAHPGGVVVFQVMTIGEGVVILVGDEVIVDPFGDPLGTRFGGSEDPWGDSDLDRDLDEES